MQTTSGQTQLQDQLYDIYDMSYTPWWQTTAFYWSLAVLGVVLVVLGAWFLVRKLRAKKQHVTAWDCALGRLEQLRVLSKDAAQSKIFYDRVIGILKQYLHDRFGFDTAGKTDQELVDYLATTNLAPDVLENIRNIVNGCVLVRFANQQAVVQQMEHDFALACVVVKHTIPTSPR